MPIYNQPDQSHSRGHSRTAIKAIKNYMNRNKPDMNDPINRTDKYVAGSTTQATVQADGADTLRQPSKKPTMIDLYTNQFVTESDYIEDSPVIDVASSPTFSRNTITPPVASMVAPLEYVSDVDDSEDDNYYVFSSRGLRYGAPIPMHHTHKSSRSNSEHSRKRPSFETMAAAVAHRSSSQPPNRSAIDRTSRSMSLPPAENQYAVSSHYHPHYVGSAGHQRQQEIGIAPMQQQQLQQQQQQQQQFSQSPKDSNLQLPKPLLSLLAPLTRHIRELTPRQDLRAIIFAAELLAAFLAFNWVVNNSGTVLLVSAILVGLIAVGRNNANSRRP